jgi:hypothetical protein
MSTRSQEVRAVLYDEILKVVAEALAYREMPDLSAYSSEDIFHAFQPGFVGLCQRDINFAWFERFRDKVVARRVGLCRLDPCNVELFSRSVRGAAYYGKLVSNGQPDLRVVITPTSSPITYDS